MPRKQKTGIPITDYASAKGVSATAIRKHIGTGLLRPAVHRDGSLNEALADEILSGSLVRGKAVPPPASLQDAKVRHARAKLALLQDDLADFLDGTLHPAAVEPVLGEARTAIRRAFDPLLDVAESMSGGEPLAVSEALSRQVRSCLEAVVAGAAEALDAMPPRPDDAAATPVPDDADLASLQALILTAGAERMEAEHRLNRGELLRFDAVVDDFEHRCTVARAKALAIPSKMAALIGSADRDKARSLMQVALDEALAEMHVV